MASGLRGCQVFFFQLFLNDAYQHIVVLFAGPDDTAGTGIASKTASI
jgi:hypothetical protein